jgi:hypothetical protein
VVEWFIMHSGCRFQARKKKKKKGDKGNSEEKKN